jgi:mRNA-degrading endonuclease RelE of RelBE toxin-antitoxin system
MSLFKYYAPDSFDFICVEGGVSARFSQPSVLNDVFEFNGGVPESKLLTRTKSLLESCDIDIKETSEKSIEKLSKSLEDYFRDELKYLSETLANTFIGIFSLSKIKHSRSMWSYYGKDHAGFMIEFQTDKNYQPIFTIEDERYTCDFVTYTKERPINMFFSIKALKNMSEEDRNSIGDKAVLSKDYQWSHEEEYRAVRSVRYIPSIGLDSNGYKIHALTIPNSQIKSITLGVRANDTLERKAKYWIENQSPTTKLYRAKPCATEYKFNSIEIPT